MKSDYLDASNATAGAILHPYFPLSVALPTYIVNSLSTFELLSYFALGCAVIFGMTHLLVQKTRPSMSRAEELTTMWFMLSGFIHLFFEGV